MLQTTIQYILLIDNTRYVVKTRGIITNLDYSRELEEYLADLEGLAEFQVL